MVKEKTELILMTLFVIILVLSAIVVIFLFTIGLIDVSYNYTVTNVKQVDCYDKYGHKIEGVKCQEDIYCGWLSKEYYKEYCYGEGK